MFFNRCYCKTIWFVFEYCKLKQSPFRNISHRKATINSTLSPANFTEIETESYQFPFERTIKSTFKHICPFSIPILLKLTKSQSPNGVSHKRYKRRYPKGTRRDRLDPLDWYSGWHAIRVVAYLSQFDWDKFDLTVD